MNLPVNIKTFIRMKFPLLLLARYVPLLDNELPSSIGPGLGLRWASPLKSIPK